ncbi:hypothetical protein EFD55_01250 [Rhizobium pisi]|uniref:Uncharacterized protein n=1 Tax=Rhizobium pisi TaxID=574561 RepID=A0A3R9ALD1_9HYPH|nr:hypothetical protein EFD55_01250 [Rhizobium pisi]
MYDWAIWLVAQIPLAAVLAVAYFFKDALASWVNARTKHSFDAKLRGVEGRSRGQGKRDRYAQDSAVFCTISAASISR